MTLTMWPDDVRCERRWAERAAYGRGCALGAQGGGVMRNQYEVRRTDCSVFGGHQPVTIAAYKRPCAALRHAERLALRDNRAHATRYNPANVYYEVRKFSTGDWVEVESPLVPSVGEIGITP